MFFVFYDDFVEIQINPDVKNKAFGRNIFGSPELPFALIEVAEIANRNPLGLTLTCFRGEDSWIRWELSCKRLTLGDIVTERSICVNSLLFVSEDA